MEQPQKKFTTPEEEIAYLRTEIARKEQELLSRNKEADRTDFETVGNTVLREYAEYEPSQVLARNHTLPQHDLNAQTALTEVAHDKVAEMVQLAHEKGIRNALSVLEKLGNAYLTDEVHRTLATLIRTERSVADLHEGMPLFDVLDMTLFEVALPQVHSEHTATDIQTLISTMEQFYAGMQSLGNGKKPSHYTLEIAVSDNQDDIIFYVAVPTLAVDLFEKQVLALFPHAVLTEQQNDYNIFTNEGASALSVGTLKKHPIYPLRMHDTFTTDPLNVLLNAFSKIERVGGGAAVQIVIEAKPQQYLSTYEGIIKRVRDGMKPETAIRKSTIGGELLESFSDFFTNSKKTSDNTLQTPSVDTAKLELFEKKIETPITATNIRLVASAKTDARAAQILADIEASFNQFEDTKSNTLVFKRLSGSAKNRALRAFSFREYDKAHALPLSFNELTTLMHVPAEGVESTPQFKQSKAKGAPAPLNLPQHGTLLGENVHRNVQTKVYLTAEDRLRHFYIIGQTGTGKTTLMKNMIVQDIEDGAGVCMIDPHGSDIEDILSNIPDSRYDDVIYFDPARTDMVMGLNMLEYDEGRPEQKTFVINELFSIFQKLYGANPESMGPMFEQYFRNATALILEDPESGSTLMDISRVLSNAAYRKHKLERAKNPVVKQFWTEIATKAGGEASLENIVPYITSKFDVFTANDFMRPIIGQQRSAFNFRDIMDKKKIVLVNLSKGRLGEINANLIGMIIVGKILMAALSRVDDPTKSFPPFYLHIDEFQNVTTNSIAAILSEARKYKLGLTIAHQFIAQLDERIKDAVFGNVGSLAAFRVGPEDAQFLAEQFEPVFSANDLMNVENRNAYVRILADGTPTRPFNMRTMPPPPGDPSRTAALVEHAISRYGTPRRKIEMEINSRYQ